eukprot:5145806-Pleurochrysis_carterae.AAC.1
MTSGHAARPYVDTLRQPQFQPTEQRYGMNQQPVASSYPYQQQYAFPAAHPLQWPSHGAGVGHNGIASMLQHRVQAGGGY